MESEALHPRLPSSTSLSQTSSVQRLVRAPAGRVRTGGLALLAILMAQSLFASEAADTEKSIREHREWARQVEDSDYFYWKRFLYRYDNPGEFPLPPSWYNPQTIVTGTPSAPLPHASASQRRLRPAVTRELDAYLAQQDTGAFYVVRDGRIEHEYFAGGTHAGSLLPVRSITKSILGLLTGIAIAEGHIAGLDVPIGRYLPEWQGDARGRITLRQVLHMATGLEYVTLRLEPENLAMRLAEGSDVDGTALAWRQTQEPDKEFTINQVDSQILGLILQRATGRPLDEYLSEQLWQPLGLSPATLNIDARGRVRAFCCMRMVAGDLVKIGQMLLQDGKWEGRQVVPASWIRAMLEPSPASEDIGLHVFLGRSAGRPQPDNPYRPARELLRSPGVFYLQGGLSVVMWIVPREKLVIFRWGNDKPGWDMAKIPNLVIDDLASRTRAAMP